ncbi:MAG: type II secretion system minor pseudopilin GspI [Pseudomonadales bacterium]|nr:type II secretion system minor pseudopilin GspI [Pseudomonadales bacterium]
MNLKTDSGALNRIGVTRLSAGFTLLEVMVALTIFAIVAVTIQKANSQYVNSVLRIEHKTLAALVAQNTISELRLSGKIPKVGQSKSNLDFADIEWNLITKIIATQDPNMVRVELEVFRRPDRGDAIKELDFIGFIGRY